MSLKNELIKLGNKNPRLRKNISHILSNLDKRSSQLPYLGNYTSNWVRDVLSSFEKEFSKYQPESVQKSEDSSYNGSMTFKSMKSDSFPNNLEVHFGFSNPKNENMDGPLFVMYRFSDQEPLHEQEVKEDIFLNFTESDQMLSRLKQEIGKKYK